MLVATMRSPGLVIMGVLALLVVGYAAYTLTGAERPAPERVEGTAEADDEASDAKARPRPRPSELGVRPAPVSKNARPRGGPPPRPEPAVSLDKARTDFQAMLDELDGVAGSGRVLTTQEWTEYYKRGNDALQPLLQHLSWGEPDQKEELRRANEDLRAKLRAIEPSGPGAAAPPASP